ncbi:hypothetical protein PHISCL_07584 [Aspergillus sclerotialis]|uniref:Uncharacterized protein n=1 Tax=Aspergillus sclerotialis TaxID=2070753 RepID=A0A3A2ZAD3_9EURO|nr:hypothetical protein PHISCL_07584 [Aspergillus sclerotialis]
MDKLRFLKAPLRVGQSSTEELIQTAGNQEGGEKKAPSPADHSYWKPFFLSGTAALSFAVTFAAIIIGLAVLYSQSLDYNGIATTKNNLHYLWTYGPTALFTVILVYWGLLEYQAKLLAPWRAMAGSGASARDSIFLDLISPWNILVLPKAVSNKLPVPFLAITGTLLIRLLIILSTGLLVSERVSITHPDRSLVVRRNFINRPGFDPERDDSRIIRVVTAMQKWNLSDPLGTHNGYAFPIIDASQSLISPDTVVTFNASVFTADLTCEVAAEDFTFSTTNVNKNGYPATDTTVYVPRTGASFTCSAPDDKNPDSKGCPQLNVTFPSCDNPQPFQVFFTQDIKPYTAQYFLAYGSEEYPFKCKRDEPAESVAVLLRGVERPSRNRFEVDLTSLLCRPRYSIRHVPISLRNNELTPDTIAHLGDTLGDGNTDQLEGLSIWDLYRAAGPVNQLPGDPKQLNGTFAKEFLKARFNSTAAQLVRTYFMGPSGDTVPAEVTEKEERLIVREFPLIFMEVILVVLSFVCLALWFLSRHHLCPRDPGSIGGLATILTRSPLLMGFFEGTSTTPLQKLEAAHSKASYHTATTEGEDGASFGVVPSGEMEMNSGSPRDNAASDLSKWWQPIIVRTPSKIGVTLFTVALIVALEVLKKYSSSNDGIATVGNGEYIKYTWVYIPTLTMVAVSILYGMLDAAAVLFQPYTVLHRGGRFTGTVMLEDLAGKITPAALISCLSKRQITVPATKLAIIAGSMLTIAVSGLYTVQSISFTQTIPLVTHSNVQKDFWLDGGDESIGNLPAILAFDHIPYPKWTYGEFMFSHVSLANNDTSTFLGNSTSIDARVPAQRAVINCTMFDNDFDIKFTRNATGSATKWDDDGGFILSPNNPPRDCGVEITASVYEQNPYYGVLTDYTAPLEPGCPVYLMYVGSLHHNDPDNNTLSMAYCYPYLEQLELDVTFTDSNFTIDTSRPPRAVPGTSKVLARNQSLSVDSFPTFLDSGRSNPSSDHKTHGYNDNMDDFFNALIGSDMVSSASELIGPGNTDRLLNKVARLYGITAAQVLNGQVNTDLYAPTADQQRNGTILREKFRLVQSPIATHILAGLLGFMLVCSVTAYATLRTRGILPNDPCSIAAKASLLAGSKILSEDVIPPGSEWLSDEQLRVNGTFAEDRFRLKWWDGQRYGIDIEPDGEGSC